MKNLPLKTSFIIFILLSLLSHNALLADDHGHGEEHSEEEEHETSRFGPGKAILEVKNEGQYFKLSPVAEKAIGLKSQLPIATDEEHHFKVPQSSIVEYQEYIGIYRKKAGWYELVDVKIIKTTDSESLIYSKNLKSDDQIIFTRVGLLRIAHLEASGQGGEADEH